MFFICKFSSAPQFFYALGFLLEKPSDGTFQYEVFRILENLSLAYLASLIFYLIVDYIPKKREEKHTEKILEKNLTNLYMHMDKVCAYFDFTFGIDNLLRISEEQKKIIDDFCFPNNKEFLMVKHTKSGIHSGQHVEWFDAKQEIITAGKGVTKSLKDIDEILEENRANMSFISLINEVKIPQIGLGVIRTPDGADTANAVKWAIEAGYRHIDTAKVYGTEKSVGEGIRMSGIDRRDIFVTTKLWNEYIRQGRTKEAFLQSLEDMGLDYIDLYLIHWPANGYEKAWADMEDLY